jgi:hypothetical protein
MKADEGKVFDRINKIYRIGRRQGEDFDGINGITEFLTGKHEDRKYRKGNGTNGIWTGGT